MRIGQLRDSYCDMKDADESEEEVEYRAHVEKRQRYTTGRDKGMSISRGHISLK